MREKRGFFVLLLAPGVLLAAVARRVEVVAQVPLVSHVETPGVLELTPGETCLVTVRVACNQPWLLGVQTDNPHIRSTGRHAGSAGGMAAAGHTCTIMLTCAPEAVGPQRTTLITGLISGPLAAGLAR